MFKTILFFRAGKLLRAGFLALLCLAAAFPAVAVEVPTLYTAEVPFDREADDPRGEAYANALTEVLLRVSGAEFMANPEAVAELFPNPAAFIMQFRPGADDTLWVSFDGEAIERTLRDAGQTVWGADRPLTLVWLAVDWGQGTREIIGADDQGPSEGQERSIDRNRLIRERILESAERRGLPVVFPLLDTIDLQNVTFSDIWGGFDELILAGSERYDVNSVLIGRVRPGSGQGDRWTYYFSGADLSLTGPPEVVVGQVANLLAAEFAIGGDAPVETVALHVSGVVSVEAYGSVQRTLQDVSLIERFAVVQVAGDRVSYDVEVRGGADRLRRALRFNGLIEQEALDGFPSDPALEFFYSP